MKQKTTIRLLLGVIVVLLAIILWLLLEPSSVQNSGGDVIVQLG